MIVNKITVIGAGTMGAQIAMVFALKGYTVTLNDIDDDKLMRAKEDLESFLKKSLEKGLYTIREIEYGFLNLSFNKSLKESVKNADFVIEAIIEDLNIKKSLFSELDNLAPHGAILATNSSTIVSSKLASVTKRPEKICNMHFFNPPLKMELVEIVKGEHTDQSTVDIAKSLSERVDKSPIVLNKEIFGFIVSRIINVIFDESIYLYEEGIASIEDIDKAVEKGLNHPLGPFKLLDLTGIDVNYYLRKEKAKEFNDMNYYPQQTLVRMFEDNKLGRKVGEGFYKY